ncbi:MAG: aminopeptidase P family protein [Lachnospiraceae bacterium]|nr:aminopeptidase P family protein [Lachnospiraceae bacterium]
MCSSETKNRIEALHRLMTEKGVDIYTCTVGDHHMSEYICDHFKILEYFSGFSGSRATLVVSLTEAFLFTDGRYFLEAEEVLRDTGITLMREGVKDVPSLKELLSEKLQAGNTFAIDSRFFNISTVKNFISICSDKEANFISRFSEPEKLIVRRTPYPESDIFVLCEKYTGMSAIDKLAAVRASMKENNCDVHIICNLTDISYILNLRGSDIPYNPLFVSYLIIYMNYAVLFACQGSINIEIRDYLSRIGVIANNYNDFYRYAQRLSGKRILLDENRVNYAVFEAVGSKNEIFSKTNPSTLMKAVKNKTEQDNLRQASLIDGIAFIRFLYEFEKRMKAGDVLSENDCAVMLKSKREVSDYYICESFSPIIASGSNAAIVHYEYKGSGKRIDPKDSVLLLDTGGHYLYGTTDITRTVVIGSVSDEIKTMYTRVLKANISMAEAVFKKGTTGAGLDILARKELWKDGLDYRHGTGHGIGYFLSVHEGPFSVSYNAKISSNLIPLEPGMHLSDEPGYYKDGNYGIRIENDLLVVPFKETVYGEFYCFEVLTLIPFDPRAINYSMLNNDEKDYIKRYHKHILNKLSPYLSSEETKWFEDSFILCCQ